MVLRTIGGKKNFLIGDCLSSKGGDVQLCLDVGILIKNRKSGLGDFFVIG